MKEIKMIGDDLDTIRDNWSKASESWFRDGVESHELVIATEAIKIAAEHILSGLPNVTNLPRSEAE